MHNYTEKLILVVNNVRSALNIGAMWRTADAVGAEKIIICGNSPHPAIPQDNRPGHVITRHEREIAKSALGAEKTVPFEYYESLDDALATLRAVDYTVYAIECKRTGSISLFKAPNSAKVALVLGSETVGLSQAECDKCDAILEIPMQGTKGSLNVSVAAGIALYYFAKTNA